MKKITKKTAVVLLLLGGFLCYAQNAPNVRMQLLIARLQLNQSSPDYNPTNALATYNLLAKQGNAEAMNGLGMIYLKGIGVPANEFSGKEWLEKSANAGYANAWYNLGLLYTDKEPTKALLYFEKAATSGYLTAYAAWGRMLMKGEGIPQDYTLAFSIFKQGADKGNAYCNYTLGYLYYKGFGCAQDYALAIERFEIAAQKNYPWAMYMLGLCYRNGYGVAINKEKAEYWLTKSAAMGIKPSQNELDDPETENSNPSQVKTVSKPIDEIITITGIEAPETFKKVKQASIKENISGKYTGNVLRYDWSGQNIISSTPIAVFLQQEGKQLTGEWKEEAGDSVSFTAHIQENTIVFKDSKIDRTEHFYKGGLNTYEFKNAQLQLLKTEESLFLIGNIQLYNIKERENEKPMYLILEKKQNKSAEIQEIISAVTVYPNPFASSFELRFDLATTANVTVSIHSISGQLLSTTQWQHLKQGVQTKTISLNAPSGYYVLRLNYGQEVKSTLLIKN